jgi:hypothetical protein
MDVLHSSDSDATVDNEDDEIIRPPADEGVVIVMHTAIHDLNWPLPDAMKTRKIELRFLDRR